MTDDDDDKDEKDRAYLASYARRLGLPDMSEASLARALGIDVFTGEYLERWFEEKVRPFAEPQAGAKAKVVQDGQPDAERPALSPQSNKSGGDE